MTALIESCQLDTPSRAKLLPRDVEMHGGGAEVQSIQSRDNFDCLSPELQLTILSHLNSNDIVALRRASRIFRFTHPSVSRRLIEEEKP